MYYREIRDLKKFYSDNYPDLTDYEATMLAIETQRNEILAAGLVVYEREPSVPTGIEKIAMELHELDGTLDEIREALRDISELMDEKGS